MIRKIVSGGQTGVDRAALDVALSIGLPCGGWCPKGRLAEDRRVPRRYPLRETPSREYVERTAWNVRDSDATLVLTWGPPTDGTAFTVQAARRQNKPCLVVDLAEVADVEEVVHWLEDEGVRTLNVAGPRASKCASIYDETVTFLRRVLGAEPAEEGGGIWTALKRVGRSAKGPR